MVVPKIESWLKRMLCNGISDLSAGGTDVGQVEHRHVLDEEDVVERGDPVLRLRIGFARGRIHLLRLVGIRTEDQRLLPLALFEEDVGRLHANARLAVRAGRAPDVRAMERIGAQLPQPLGPNADRPLDRGADKSSARH